MMQKGLSVILFFIGAKMLLEIIHFEIPVVVSFGVNGAIPSSGAAMFVRRGRAKNVERLGGW